MPQNPSAVSPELLDRYLAGDIAPDERQRVEHWLAENPGEHHLLSMLRAGVSEAYGPLPPYDFDARVDQIVAAGIRETATPVTSATRRTQTKPGSYSGPPITSRFIPRTFPRIAGLLAATIGILWLGALTLQSRQTVRSHTPITYVSTASGQRSTIKLSDGTTVTLNVASQIRLSQDFARNRTIELTGEAFFNVAHAADAPFVVETGDVRTTVLGTEFAVRAYQPSDVHVAVRTGKVSVSGVVLNANDIAHVRNDTAIDIRRNAATEPVFGFVSGRLFLNNIPLHTAAADLTRWYDVDIQFGDAAIANLPITAILPSGSVGDLIDILKLTFASIRIERDGRLLTIYSR